VSGGWRFGFRLKRRVRDSNNLVKKRMARKYHGDWFAASRFLSRDSDVSLLFGWFVDVP
jgi:hypothetical protein